MAAATARAVIHNKYGFHVRPSTSFSQMARQYAAAIEVEVEGNRVDGKSVMMLMTLGATQGAEVTIHADGDDAEEAVASLKAHIDDSFGGID